MKLIEMAPAYRESARLLKERIALLEEKKSGPDMSESRRLALQWRINTLQTMYNEARDIAVLTEKYYIRGYRKNGNYTL